ncbi:STAS domain-containing protein [Kitasatospora sp. NPDC006697]|uniref:STAS domain-containing protein n=1 Tax=Kitasatospora sp. NPDC006697 TaxID=3364020 RepID=UPI0036B8F27C
MTAHPAPDPGSDPSDPVTVRVEDDLDHETCDTLLAAVAGALRAHPSARAVRLDCGAMTMCDSMGLSALLQVRRLTDTAGLRLVIDHRPPLLDRLLELTGTADYLLGPPGPA